MNVQYGDNFIISFAFLEIGKGMSLMILCLGLETIMSMSKAERIRIKAKSATFICNCIGRHQQDISPYDAVPCDSASLSFVSLWFSRKRTRFKLS